jgi:hypothetical protein
MNLKDYNTKHSDKMWLLRFVKETREKLLAIPDLFIQQREELIAEIDSTINKYIAEITPIKGQDYFTEDEKTELIKRVESLIPLPIDGKDGKTPIKGEDYFTPDEIESIKAEISKAIPTPKHGRDGKAGTDGITTIIQQKADLEAGDIPIIARGLEDLPNDQKLDPEKALKDFSRFMAKQREFIVVGGGGSNSSAGASAFIDLTDVPGSYVGQAGKVPQVNNAETGLQFLDIAANYLQLVPQAPLTGDLDIQADLSVNNIYGNNTGSAFLLLGYAPIAGNVDGQPIAIVAGTGFGTGNGGTMDMAAGDSGLGATGNGGALTFQAGTSYATNGNGGDINFSPGGKSGSGTNGRLRLNDPSSGNSAYIGTSLLTNVRNFEFPDASGTLALTSDLASYLKLDASNDPLTGPLTYSGLLQVFATGFTNPTSGTSVAHATSNFAVGSPGNVLLSDDVRATLGASTAFISEYLYASGFGFSLPSDAVITGFTARTELNANIASTIIDYAVRLRFPGGVDMTSNKASATAWGVGDHYVTYTWTTAGVDFPAGLTAADINSSAFGYVHSDTGLTGTVRQARIDNMQISVQYTSATGVAKYATIGVDTADYAKFKLSASSTIGTNDLLSVDIAGVTANTFIFNEDGSSPAASNLVVLRGSLGQTGNLISFQTSTGLETLGIGVGGGLAVNVNETSVSFPVGNTNGAVSVQYTHTISSPETTGTILGQLMRLNVAGSSTHIAHGFSNNASSSVLSYTGTGSIDVASASYNNIVISAAGTITNGSVVVATYQDTAPGLGFITNLRLYHAAQVENWGGVGGGEGIVNGTTITNLYGFYGDYINQGATSNYGIWLNGAKTETAHFETGVATGIGEVIQLFSAQSADAFRVTKSDTTILTKIDKLGRLGLQMNTTALTAYLHIAAGTATASTAPIKLTSGTNMTTAETGAIEYNGANLFFTRTGTTRESVLVGNDGASAPATNTIGILVDYYGSSATRVLSTPNSWASVVIAGTTYKIPLYT